MRDIVGHADMKTGRTYDVRMSPPDSPGPESFMTPADREFYHIQGALRFMPNNYTPGSQSPRRMGADKTGNAIWVGNWWGGNLAKIDIKTMKATYYPLPFKYQHPYSAVIDKNHMVYTNVSNDDEVAKFDPKTGQWTLYKLP